MESLNIIKDITARFGLRQIAPTADPIPLEETEEPFCRGVIATVANRAHAADNVVIAQKSQGFTTGELRPAVGVRDHRAVVFSLPVRHQNRLEHEMSVLPSAHRPADDHVVVEVNDRSHIQPALAGTDIGDIRHPPLIGRRRAGSPLIITSGRLASSTASSLNSRLYCRLFGPIGHLLLPMMKLFRCVRSYEVEPYLPMSRQARYNLFQLVHSLYEYRSIVLTTNRDFTDWGEFFAEDQVAVPVIDRIIHHSHIFKLGGESYRLKEKTAG